MSKTLLAWLLSTGSLPLAVAACDSGFVKVGDPEPEPEPRPEPEAEPESERSLDSGAGVSEPSFFVPPSVEALDAEAATPVSELDDEELRSWCEAQQARLVSVREHYEEDAELCRLIAVAESIEGVTTQSAFRDGCYERFDECIEEGPERPIEELVSEGLASFACSTWQVDRACDPTVEDVTRCLDDAVENLSRRLSEWGDCDSSRADVVAGRAARDELGIAPSAFALSDRCEAAACLSASASADAGR